MAFDVEQTLSANIIDAPLSDIIEATDSNVRMAPTDQSFVVTPPVLGPLDLAWMARLLENAENPDISESSLEQSSFQLAPYQVPNPPAFSESTAIVSKNRPSHSWNAGERLKPKR